MQGERLKDVQLPECFWDGAGELVLVQPQLLELLERADARWDLACELVIA